MSNEPYDSVKATTSNTPAPEKGSTTNQAENKIDTQVSPPAETPNGSVVTPSAVTAANARNGG